MEGIKRYKVVALTEGAVTNILLKHGYDDVCFDYERERTYCDIGNGNENTLREVLCKEFNVKDAKITLTTYEQHMWPYVVMMLYHD